MSALNIVADFPCKREFQIFHIVAELVTEVCSYLGADDQLSMKRVCKWWRMNLSGIYLSKLVDMDDVRMFNQSEHLLEQALNKHVQKNTKILVLRHIHFTLQTTKFSTIAKVIKQKEADLIQLILKDCEEEREFAAAAYWWLVPQHITDRMLHGLIFATRKLILENYTVRDALSNVVLTWIDPVMPGLIPPASRRYFHLLDKLSIVLTRLVIDCAKPFHQHYHSFIMALGSNSPEVRPEVRNQVVGLYNSWIHCNAQKYQWRSFASIIKWFNEGVPVRTYSDDFDVDIPTLRRLDPLTFSKLTIEVLHRTYF